MRKNTRVILLKTGREYIVTNVFFAKQSGLPYRFEIANIESGETMEVYYHEIKEL